LKKYIKGQGSLFSTMYSYSPYIKENIDFLQRLAATKSDRKKNNLLLNSTADQILSIVEIIANVLKFNFPLTPRQKGRLSKYAEFYRSLARVRSEKSARKHLQEGKGIAIGAILVPVLAELARSLIQKI
jgi:hypothetical protein